MKLLFGHISLNVTDLKRSRAFYEKILRDFRVIAEGEHHVGYFNGEYSVWLADGSMQTGQPYTGVATDSAVGVHHFSWKVDTMEELKEWETYLREQGIEMSQGGITSDDFGGQGIFLRDPDNMRLEIHLG